MRYIFSLALLLCTLGMTIQAQSRKAEKHYAKARQAVAQKDFSEAMEQVNKALEDDGQFLEALLFKADLLKRAGADAEALPLYERAIALNPPYYVNLFYAQTLFNTGRYAESIPYFEQYIASPQAPGKYVENAEDYIASARFAAKAVASPKDFNPQNLGPKVNSRDMEYFPSISADGNTLVYTHRSLEGDDQDEDFWQSRRDSLQQDWTKGQPLQGFLNTPLNEGAQSITSDGKIIYFAACERQEGYGSCDIFASVYRGKGIWSKPINLGPGVNSGMWESQPSISSDGKTLYFTRGKSSKSKNIDLYYSTIDEAGHFSKARPLEGKINTSRQEVSPFIHFDNQHLYFASNGHPGMGDLDFFVSTRNADGSWGEPQNLGYPINTPAQEFSLIVAPDGKTGYFASDAIAGGYGLLDLYQFQLPEESRAVEIAYVKGKVINRETREPISARIEFTDLTSQQQVLNEQSDRGGNYFSVLPANSDYALSIEKAGFLFYSKNFSLSDNPLEKAFVLNVELVPIAVGKKVKLDNVFFDFDSYKLDEMSFAELATVKRFLEENPNVKVSIEGHTDNEGSPSYNRQLSTNRAKAVYEYLATQGIKRDRMKYEGFGADQPVAGNDTEAGRALNRRTELRITAN